MGTESRTNIDSLVKDVIANGSQYNVFQAIYLCERWYAVEYQINSRRNLDQSGFRLQPHPIYEFPPTDLRSVEFFNGEFRFVLNFMGLYGIDSPLSRCYHESVCQFQQTREEEKNPLQDFLDLFSNRLYWLYYQSWKKYRYYLELAKNNGSKGSRAIFAFSGNEKDIEQQENLVSPHALRSFSGLFVQKTRSKTGVLLLLRGFFPKIQFHIKEFVPVMVEVENCPTMGVGSSPRYFLGKNTILGKYVADRSSRICIRIGPISSKQLLRFFPGSTQMRTLDQLVLKYLPDNLEYDIEVVVKSNTIGKSYIGNTSQQLGKDLWLGHPYKEFVKRKYPHHVIRQSVRQATVQGALDE